MSHILARISLKLRITLTFVFIVSLLLAAAIMILGLQIGHMIREDTDVQMQQISMARADQVGELLGKLEWQLRSYSENDVFSGHDTKKINAYLEHLMGRHSNEISNINYAGVDGKGHSSLGNNIDISQRDYFKQVIAVQSAIVISEALISQSTKKPSFIMALKLSKPDGTFDGVLSFTVSLEKFSELTSAIKIGKSGYSWICDSRGVILAFPEEAQILKLNINSADQQGYRGLTAFAGKLMQTEKGTGTWFNQAGTQVTSFYSKIEGAPGWKLGINLPTSEVNRTFTAMISILVLVLILGVVAAILMAYFLAVSIVKPIQQAALGFKELAQGEADLTKQIPILREDEVGQMVQNFNHFVVKLREMVLNLKDSQVQISKVAKDLSDSSVHTVSTVVQITDSLVKAKEDAEKQNESALQSAAAVSEIAKNIESLDKIIADQADSVVQASSSVEEMTRNIESVFLSMEKLSQEFQTLSSSAEEGKQSSEQSSLLVKEIFERSSALQEANKAVASIASQTNLLAMNAAIEAAHAGQSGKGFAVVADEIRKLAESSSVQSKSISDDIGAVQKGIQKLVDSNTSFSRILNELESKVSLTQNIVKEVHSAMSEQQEGSRQMLLTLESLNSLTSTVKNGSQEMKSGNDTLIEETQNLRNSAQSILITIDEITQGAQILKEASKIVDTLAEDTKSSTLIMETSIGRFKI